MATKGFRQPFHIKNVSGQLEVGAVSDSRFAGIYECADLGIAAEISLVANVVWQRAEYGCTDPALWTEFCNQEFSEKYTVEDVSEIILSIREIGLLRDIPAAPSLQ